MTEQNEIGTFIAVCRKEKKMTQKQLGERLGVTDRAVSKWETGRSFPDVSLLEPLCQELGVSVSELLAAKKIEPENYQKETEKMLMASVSSGQLMGLQVVLYVLTFAMFSLVELPVLIRYISGMPFLNYISVTCWILALILIFCVSYLDKKLPARKFRNSNANMETLVGGMTFLGIMAVNFIVSGGLSSLKGANVPERIYVGLLVIAGFGISIGVRRIMAQTRREEWEIEQEKKEMK